jgi:hypothetical protein
MTEPTQTEQATLFADLPIDATASEAQTALASLRDRVSARIAPLGVELLAVAALAESDSVVDDASIAALYLAVVELSTRLRNERRRRDEAKGKP